VKVKKFAPKESLSMSPAVPPCHAWLIPQADPDQPVEIGSGVPWSITILLNRGTEHASTKRLIPGKMEMMGKS